MTDSMDDWERRREERRQKREDMRRETERMINLRSCEDEEEAATERRRRAREERLRSGTAAQETPGDAPVNNVRQETNAKIDGRGGGGGGDDDGDEAEHAERLRRREERRQKRQQQQQPEEEEEEAAAAAAAAREEEAEREREREEREREREREKVRERERREQELQRQQEEEEEERREMERRLRHEEEEEEERKKALEDEKEEDDYDEKKDEDSRSWGKSSRANGRSRGLGDDDDDDDEADDDEEEEERRRQQQQEEEEERAAREEEEDKQRRREEAERQRLADDKRRKISALAETSSGDADESFGGLLPRASGKLSEMTESLSRSVQRSGSLKAKQPPLEICKIDSKLELYTSAAESAAKAAKPPKQGVPDLPVAVDTIASKKNMWETGDVYSGVAAPKGSSNKELAVIKVGVANRISQWGTKSPDVADSKVPAQPAKPTDLRPVDILSKRSMWEHMSDAPASERDKSALNKSTPSGKRYKFIITGHGKYEKVPIEEGEDCENGLEQYVNEV